MTKLNIDKALANDVLNSDKKVNNEASKEASYSQYSEDKFKEQRNLIVLASMQNDIDTQKFLTGDLFKIIKKWLLFIGFIVVCAGLNIEIIDCFPFICIYPFYLSDKVLITLLGSTTLTVIGLYSPVIAHFFYRSKK